MSTCESELTKNLIQLVKVKTIVTFAVIGVFSVLALRGSLEPDVVMGVVTMVTAFYFGTQSQKNAQ